MFNFISTDWIEQLEGCQLLVVGDIMLDRFVQGRVERISPEAPIPVLQVEKEQLAMALKGANDETRALFFGNMSERAGKIMEEDMEALGAVRKSEVDQARASVMDTAKTLSDEGQLVLPGGGEDDELMY